MKYSQTLLLLSTLAILSTLITAMPTDDKKPEAPKTDTPKDAKKVDEKTPAKTPKRCPSKTDAECAATEVCSPTRGYVFFWDRQYSCVERAKEGKECGANGLLPAGCADGLICNGWLTGKCTKKPLPKKVDDKKTEEKKDEKKVEAPKEEKVEEKKEEKKE
jgi:hypothetical protein